MDTDLERSLVWSRPQEFLTRRGACVVRKAPVNDIAREIWKSRRDRLVPDGYSLSKEPEGTYTISHWSPPTLEDPEVLNRIRTLSRSTTTDFEPPSPAGLNFFDYQKAGIAFMWEVRNCLLADEMGVGKTPQAIGLANTLVTRRGARWILVVTLKNLKINWQRELASWLTFPATIVSAPDVPPASLDDLFAEHHSKTRILVMSYHQLPRWSIHALNTPWDLFIADEAHEMGNPRTRHAKVGLAVSAARKIFATGTPIENRPIDVWPLIHSLDPRRFNNFASFASRYCDAKRKVVPIPKARRVGRNKDQTTMTVWDYSGSSNLDELCELLRGSIMIRRTKCQVQKDLPAKSRQIVELKATSAEVGDELGLFMKKEEQLLDLRVALEKARVGTSIEDYQRAVRQLHRGIRSSFKAIGPERCQLGLSKVPVAILHLKSLIDSGHKVLVFAHHQEVCRRIHTAFRKQSVMITGSQSPHERQKRMDAFQTDGDVRMCMASIKGCGTGANLTAASHVVFVEFDWVPAAVLQCEDRAHRIGLKQPLLVQFLVLENSLDSRMARIISEKLTMLGRAIDGRAEDAPVCAWSNPSAAEDADPIVLAREGEGIGSETRAQIIRALREIASFCDHGRSNDNAGFSAIDAPIGHELSRRKILTAPEAAMGLRLVKRYRRQVGIPLACSILGEEIRLAPVTPILGTQTEQQTTMALADSV